VRTSPSWWRISSPQPLSLELPHCMNFRIVIYVQAVRLLVSKRFYCFPTHKFEIYIYNFPERRLVLAVIWYKTNLGSCSECKFNLRCFCLLCIILFNEKREDLFTITQFWLFGFKITDRHLQRINIKGNELCAQHSKQRSCSDWLLEKRQAESHFWQQVRHVNKVSLCWWNSKQQQFRGNQIFSDQHNSKCSRCYSPPFYHGHAVFPRRSWGGHSF
jgi:hypothetical protein